MAAAARLAFRFFAVYFGIYVVVTQMFRGLIPFSINIPNISAVGPVRWMVEWTAVNVFGVTTPLVFTGSGSGDKTTDWVLAFCLVIITTAITAVWSIAARRPVNYDSAHKWFRLFPTLLAWLDDAWLRRVKADSAADAVSLADAAARAVRTFFADGRAVGVDRCVAVL